MNKLIVIKPLKVGDGTEADIFFGPVQNKTQFEKVRDLLSSIATDKLKIALGGSIENSSGYYIHPTIVEIPSDSSRAVQEEPFASILPFLKWSDEDDVIQRANALETGLGSSAWSQDFSRATRTADRL